jgi:hypothetical protein
MIDCLLMGKVTFAVSTEDLSDVLWKLKKKKSKGYD